MMLAAYHHSQRQHHGDDENEPDRCWPKGDLGRESRTFTSERSERTVLRSELHEESGLGNVGSVPLHSTAVHA